MGLALPFHHPVLRSGDLPFSRREACRKKLDDSKRYAITYESMVPGSSASFASFPEQVPAAIASFLLQEGRRPYSHQSETAVEFLGNQKNVVLSTPTASGKTISFLASVLSALISEPGSTALMVYPMNALATDQRKVLKDLGFKEAKTGLLELELGGVTIRAGLLNGDTPEKTRRALRSQGNLILTNPSALHHVLLAQSGRAYKDGSSWNAFLSGLRCLVIDEGHSYNGVGGTHVALTFQRLCMLARKRGGAVPRVLMASATIGNPVEHAENLTGLGNWALVDRSGAATFERQIKIAVPTLHPNGKTDWHPSLVAQDLALEERARGRRVLIFCNSRNATERIADRINHDLGFEVAVPFHAGIPSEVKQKTLERILAKQIEIVCATSTLELGVDIGGLDTTIILGHPGDHAAFNQRAGRVGRTGQGLVYLVLDESQHPMNIFLRHTPTAIHWAPECRTIYPGNRFAAVQHAACAFLETQDERLVQEAFPQLKEEEIQAAITAGPHNRVNLMGTGNFGQFKALDPEGKVIQELGGETALLNWHIGASIRNPRGDYFTVTEVDLKGQRVLAEPDGMRHTTPKVTIRAIPDMDTLVEVPDLPLQGVQDAVQGDFDIHQVTETYTEVVQQEQGPDQIQVRAIPPTDQNPPIGFNTRGVAFVISEYAPLVEAILGNLGAGEVILDAMAQTVGLFVQARGQDVPVKISSDERGLAFLIFDFAEGGMGWAEALAPKLDVWIAASGRALLDCSCGMCGCPRCSLGELRGHPRREVAEAMVRAGIQAPTMFEAS